MYVYIYIYICVYQKEMLPGRPRRPGSRLCWKHYGALPISSNQEPDFKSRLPASLGQAGQASLAADRPVAEVRDACRTII